MNLKDGRWRESILLLLAFIGTGIQLSVTGPVLPDLAHRTGNTLSEYGILFLTRAIGYIFGAFVAIPVVDKIEIMFLMMFVCLGNAAAAVGLVFCSTLAQVSSVLSFDGFTMGFLDSAGKCHQFLTFHRIKRSASSRWSFRTNSARDSKETTIRKTHLNLL